MLKAQEIIDFFNNWAPQPYAEDWDNVGLILGDPTQQVKKILVALDATNAVVDEAIAGNFDFLITHHPIIYNPISRITTSDIIGNKIIKLLKNGIGCFCAHTNLDKAVGGVSDCLARKIGLENTTPLIPDADDSIGIGRVGFLPSEICFLEFFLQLKKTLGMDLLRFCGDEKKPVRKIALCGGDGSGNRYVEAAIKQNCDVYITGDLRYHSAQDAVEQGLSLVDITHYAGEVLIVDEIVSQLANSFGSCNVEILASLMDGQVFKK